MAVRTETRRGKRYLIVDIRYKKSDGTPARYRHDAEVQTRAAASAEDRRRLVALATTGSPYEHAAEAAPTPKPTTRTADEPKLPTFKVVAESYLAEFAPSHLKASTRYNYAHVIRGFFTPRLGDLTIDRIDTKVVRELDVELVERGARPSTRRNVQAVLRSILCRYAVEAKLLSHPPELPKLPKVGRNIISAMTEEQVERLLNACYSAEHRLAFMLAAYAGVRGGELRGLRWRDVNVNEGYLVVRQNICHGQVGTPKSGHERKVPLTNKLKAELSKVDKKRRGLDAFVALSAHGRPWAESGLGLAFGRAAKRAGLEGWHLHDLRHFFVTALFRSGTSAPTVQALAGHADLSTTQRYAHVAEVDLRDAIWRLGGNSGATRPDEG